MSCTLSLLVYNSKTYNHIFCLVIKSHFSVCTAKCMVTCVLSFDKCGDQSVYIGVTCTFLFVYMSFTKYQSVPVTKSGAFVQGNVIWI